MRLLLCITLPALILGARILWVRAHRTTPFYVRVTDLGSVFMDLHDGESMGGVPLGGAQPPRLVRHLPRGGYALMFRLPEDRDFCVSLGYAGPYRQRLDLDVSPAPAADQWHIRLVADSTVTLFERDVAFREATDEHPCIIRF